MTSEQVPSKKPMTNGSERSHPIYGSLRRGPNSEPINGLIDKVPVDSREKLAKLLKWIDSRSSETLVSGFVTLSRMHADHAAQYYASVQTIQIESADLLMDLEIPFSDMVQFHLKNAKDAARGINNQEDRCIVLLMIAKAEIFANKLEDAKNTINEAIEVFAEISHERNARIFVDIALAIEEITAQTIGASEQQSIDTETARQLEGYAVPVNTNEALSLLLKDLMSRNCINKPEESVSLARLYAESAVGLYELVEITRTLPHAREFLEFDMGLSEAAEYHFQTARTEASKILDDVDRLVIVLFIAETQINVGKFSGAEISIGKAMEIFEKLPEDIEPQKLVLLGLALEQTSSLLIAASDKELSQQ